MYDTNHFKTLKNEELINRVIDFRKSLLPVLNESTLLLLEEIERRLGGGGPLTPFELLPKKEQELRNTYESLKNFAATSKSFLFRGIEPYEDWKVNHLKFERERRQHNKDKHRYLNDWFSNKAKKYLKENAGKTYADIDFKLTERAIQVSDKEIIILAKNKQNSELLQTVLNIQNTEDVSMEDKTKYWLFTREKYEKAKRNKK